MSSRSIIAHTLPQIGGVVVPLVVTLGHNNKIAMVEKFGTSEFDNSTGAYELDLSLVDNFELAWRTMHVKSDVFCSASIVLPDKGARQLNVGGWSLDSTQGVRLYWPDGSAGVNGTNDWEENWDELHLIVSISPVVSHYRAPAYWVGNRISAGILRH